MSELLGPLFIKQDPGLRLEAEISSDQYSRYATTYSMHVDNMMDVATSEMIKTSATPDKLKDTYDTVTWRIDGDVTDDTFDYALRLAARVKGVIGSDIPEDIMGGKAYPVNTRWNHTASNLSANGLYLIELDCRPVKICQLKPGELTVSYSDQTWFTHKLESGDVTYRADHTKDSGVRLGPLPSHESMVANVYGQFLVKHAREIIDSNTLQEFTAATVADAQDVHGPSDKLSEYRAIEKEKRTSPEVLENIRPLAAALYAAQGNLYSPGILNQIAANTSLAETATLARLNKNSYSSQSFKQTNRHLGNRLGWVAGIDGTIATRLRESMRSDVEGLAENFETAMEQVKEIVQVAGAMSLALQSPKTMSMPKEHWIMRAR